VATITEWLASLGLPEYAQRFAENGIDFSVLRYLTDQDLEKIGVLLGHRRKMLAAIAEKSYYSNYLLIPVFCVPISACAAGAAGRRDGAIQRRSAWGAAYRLVAGSHQRGSQRTARYQSASRHASRPCSELALGR
jgi:SAM domain (Sterile alpha motif)